MIARRSVVAALAGGTLAPLASLAQQAPRVARIGFLSSESAAGMARRMEDLRAGLRDFGYVEGRNLVIEWRWAEGREERLAELAADLVRLKVDVIVGHAGVPLLAAKRATATIPIVIASTGDAVASGLVASLAKPGGNITGSTFFNPELMAKRIELLKEILPGIARVAVLLHPDSPVSAAVHAAMLDTAKSLKVGLQRFDARSPDEFEGVFAAMAAQRMSAVVVHEHPRFNANAGTVAELAAKHRLVSIGSGEFAEGGGMIGYGASFAALYRRAGYFVDRILKGAKPADLPVERPTKFDFVVNVVTAKRLGIALPQSILLRADRVID